MSEKLDKPAEGVETALAKEIRDAAMKLNRLISTAVREHHLKVDVSIKEIFPITPHPIPVLEVRVYDEL